jgi:RNA polymerase sigma factor (sigma-70 family)
VVDRARKHRRRRTETPLRDVPDVAGPVDDRSSRLDLAIALAGLSERQRLAVSLFYVIGLTMSDAATVMNCSEGTVKSTLHDARGRLRLALGDGYR